MPQSLRSKAVELMFDVKVKSVKVINMQGKTYKNWAYIWEEKRLEKSLCQIRGRF